MASSAKNSGQIWL